MAIGSYCTSPAEAKKHELTEDNFMLVNMAVDSAEKINVAGTNPEIVHRLKKRYETWIEEVVNQD